MLRVYLRRLFQAGAFKGATEEEAFFVNCDAVLNTPFTLERGQIIAEIGVAPAEPIEFIVLRLTRDGDGTLSIEE
jgi:phage tail sheath protein FI